MLGDENDVSEDVTHLPSTFERAGEAYPLVLRRDDRERVGAVAEQGFGLVELSSDLTKRN